ncbi:MAG: 4a-hydroxytetrahydrobiopterin dehydratase [Rhodocyclaceae bacterium]|jgi:4a-hydroxytetrahydrobiopterin dehydratase|nr:4a-hydroxytetrahydrobiopterin dehydratase [Rhodocyclaceae bacterium]
MLNDQEIATRLAALEGWKRAGNAIVKTYRFANFHETMAFVNALAWIAQRSDHHPDLEVGYDRCRVSFSTHSAGGLTEKDFANAARIDALFFAP